MKGFFAGSTLLTAKAPTSSLPKCGACGLYKGCRTPKMPYSGEGRRKILIVGEFPHSNDDEEGIHFTGGSGELLQDTLSELGIEMREDCWLTNAIICYPPEGRMPTKRPVVDYCRPNLLKTVRELNPNVIILLGAAAVQSYISEVWKESPGPITKWVGWAIPCQKPNVWICPTYDPLYISRERNDLLRDVFKNHIKVAIEKAVAKPWKEIPDYTSRIEVIMDHVAAAKVIRKMQERGGVIALDYENNCLKPETPGGEIVCVSVCWQGRKTIACPWHGDVIEATTELVHADNVQLIAANLKHEDRWTRKATGRPVRHWIWDTMLAAHVLDNRPGICSLKFLAFVVLGAEAYDEHIKRFLKEKKGSRLNQVKDEVDLHQLLQYCGTDTLLEYLLAEAQVRQMILMFGDDGYVPVIPETNIHQLN